MPQSKLPTPCTNVENSDSKVIVLVPGAVAASNGPAKSVEPSTAETLEKTSEKVEQSRNNAGSTGIIPASVVPLNTMTLPQGIATSSTRKSITLRKEHGKDIDTAQAAKIQPFGGPKKPKS
jgi:hypothetical protein